MADLPVTDANSEPSDADGSESDPGAVADCEGWVEEWDRCRGVLDAYLRHRLPDAADRDDCLQAVGLIAFAKGGQVPPALRRAWLFRVATNQAALHWRKRSTETKVLRQHAAGTGEAVTQPEAVWESLTRQETIDRVRSSLRDQPPLAREMIRMKFFESLTYQQIAERLDVPLGTALSTVRRTLQRLRDQLSDERP